MGKYLYNNNNNNNNIAQGFIKLYFQLLTFNFYEKNSFYFNFYLLNNSVV